MGSGIVTDSTCDIPAWLLDQYNIEVVPSILVMDGVEHIDGEGMTRDEFYERLPGLKKSPTTASSSMGEFARRYEALLSRGYNQIISIHAPEALTSILNTARQAAQEFPGKVTCIDSGSLSLGLGFQVLAAAEAADLSLPAALEAIESTHRRSHLLAALDTLEYVKRSGRVPAALATLGGLLSVKPIIELSDGEVRPIGAVRTTQQANERMLNLLLQEGNLEQLAILHTGAEARARELLNAMMQKASQAVPRNVLLVNVTTVIGTHVGPNGLGYAAVRARKTQ